MMETSTGMTDPPTLLLIEDDDELASLLLDYFRREGFEVEWAASGDDGIDQVLRASPDLVVLDLMLPGRSGLEVCREVRDQYRGAILILTASQRDADHIAGLELGADDFVIKPVDPRVLLARIRTQLSRLRRNEPATVEESGTLQVGVLQLETTLRVARVGRVSVPLTAMEFDILTLLVRNTGSVVHRADLYRDILDIEYDGLDRGMDVHVSRIRRKLQQCGFDRSGLRSVRGAGYLLVAP